MKIVLSVDQQKEAFRKYVDRRVAVYGDEDLVVTMPTFAGDTAEVEIVKKPPQEQPQE